MSPSDCGPLHISPVTWLAWLPGRILLSDHMGNFSPVDRYEINSRNKTKNGGTILYRLPRLS